MSQDKITKSEQEQVDFQPSNLWLKSKALWKSTIEKFGVSWIIPGGKR